MSLNKNVASTAAQAELCRAFEFACLRVLEGYEVAQLAAHDVGTNAEWGAVNLISWLDDQFERVNYEACTCDDLELLSSHCASVIALVELVAERRRIFQSVVSLLYVAKARLDECTSKGG